MMVGPFANRSSSRGALLALGAAFTVLAGAAHAQTAATDSPAPLPAVAIGPAFGQSPAPRISIPLAYAQANAVAAESMPTSIEHRVAPKDFVASMGFICGLQPPYDNSGSAAAFGYDPHGRFVGAKISYAFK